MDRLVVLSLCILCTTNLQDPIDLVKPKLPLFHSLGISPPECFVLIVLGTTAMVGLPAASLDPLAK